MQMSAKIEQLVAMRLTTYFKTQTMTPALTELKTELATDLNEAANDKERSGMEPEEAVAEAFSDFGDINDLIKQINDENGTTQTIHGHHVEMNEEGIMVDDGETLKINGEGVSINHGAIQANANGVKLGSWTVDGNGINLNGDDRQRPDFVQPSIPINLTGEYHDNLPLVNEQRLTMDQIVTIAINYKSARVKILPTQGAGDEIIIREYMNHKNPAYKAQVEQVGNSLQVVQGKVPFLIPLRVHVQIQIPVDFTGDLALISHSGSVLAAGLERLNQFSLKLSSGSARLAALQAQALSAEVISGSCDVSQVQVAEQLGLIVKSGRVRLSAVTAGTYTVSATSGSIIGSQLRGGGSWKAKSGSLKLDFASIDGDINLDAHSGSVKVTTPTAASYRYELESHSGRVKAPRTGQAEHVADSYQTGRVGATGDYLIRGRAHSGSIYVY